MEVKLEPATVILCVPGKQLYLRDTTCSLSSEEQRKVSSGGLRVHGGHFLKGPQCRLEGHGDTIMHRANVFLKRLFMAWVSNGILQHHSPSAAHTLARRPIILNAKEVLGCFLCRYMQVSMQM